MFPRVSLASERLHSLEAEIAGKCHSADGYERQVSCLLVAAVRVGSGEYNAVQRRGVCGLAEATIM